MSKPAVIIIGAGITGLIAAKKLSPHFQVIILEAASRTGGRLYSIRGGDQVIEAGAEFIHGNLPVTLQLLQEAGIPYTKISGEMYRKRNGRFITVEEMTEGWDRVLEQMKSVAEDVTLQELLDKYFAGPADVSIREHVKSYAEGFDLADITRASVKSLYKEWSAESDDNYRIPAGYGALIKYLQQECESGGTIIYTDSKVGGVQWTQNSVTVHTLNGEQYTADKLLVTVPVSLLQHPDSAESIRFTPGIHFDKEVAGRIGFGAVIKVVIRFKHPFWQKDAGFILSDELFPTWWTQLPARVPLLTGWLGGPKAAALSTETDDIILEKALASLAAIYDLPVPGLTANLEEGMIFNWQKNKYALGAYSYATPLSGEAKNIINTPLEDTIFFAGEALYNGDHPGTVEAALVSGIETAARIRKH
ncbi:MAG: NAD(P)/FAD-dependent oxidoreductase [Ferruginibacter sp.]